MRSYCHVRYNLLSILLLSHTITSQSSSQVKEAIELAQDFFRGNEDILPNVVRFSFHSCVGSGCNGCINMDNVDNKGLEESFNNLNDQYLKLSNTTNFSRSDFWALFGLEALHFTVPEKQDTSIITHVFGRKDCETSPNEVKQHIYPNPRKDLTHVYESFGMNSIFKLQNREIVALIGGAHSLGDCTLKNSGFLGPWDDSENTIDSDFFEHMMHDEFIQRKNAEGNYQWDLVEDIDDQEKVKNDKVRMMLNTDFAITGKSFHIKDENTGEVDDCCPVPNARIVHFGPWFGSSSSAQDPTCQPVSSSCSYNNDEVKSWALEYADDETKLWTDFVAAYKKMLQAGQSNLVPISATVKLYPTIFTTGLSILIISLLN